MYDVDLDLGGKDLQWYDYLDYFRYILNIIFFGIPWFVISLSCVIINLYMNIAWNEWWGDGNAWLLGNTIYLVIQFLISNFLVFEWPIFVRAFRITRFISLWSSVFYIISYVISLFVWYDMLYLVQDKTQYDFVTIVVNCLLGFNLVVHSEIIPILAVIIFKETTMEFFQFLNPDAGKAWDSVAMNTGDFGTFWDDLLYWLNPFTWIDFIWDPAFGYDAEDLVFENPKDEEHYLFKK